MLQSNMLNEQKRLESVIAEKQAVIDAQAAETDRLRKQNKKLQQQMYSLQSKSKLMALHLSNAEDRDMDTPSSEDSSPKSSFSTKSAATKIIEIKSQQPTSKMSDEPRPLTKRPPPPPPNTNQVAKPPVPSRAGVNRKLQQGNSSSSSKAVPTTPPIPPPRTTSTAREFDSGRESDDQSIRCAGVTVTTVNSDIGSKDEGFISETNGYEDYLDHAGLNQKSILTPLKSHRNVQKPSDIKFRSSKKMKSASSLSVLEEHQVTPSDGGSQVTTVTYWTEPYL